MKPVDILLSVEYAFFDQPIFQDGESLNSFITKTPKNDDKRKNNDHR